MGSKMSEKTNQKRRGGERRVGRETRRRGEEIEITGRKRSRRNTKGIQREYKGKKRQQPHWI